ncbi:MAG: PIN domain-containing protein [Bacteroidota bacterium]
MIHSPKFTAILDANVLYPAPVRDLLLHLATFDLYKPKWTQTIQEEWKRNLLNRRPDLKTGQLDKTIHEMNKAFPDASVELYKSLIPTFDLPDMDDRHVLAAAVRCHAEVIVTSNLKHFPEKYLSEFEIEAQHPDHFIANLIDLNPEKSLEAFKQQVSFLRNPPMTASQVLESLEKAGLSFTCTRLRIKVKQL